MTTSCTGRHRSASPGDAASEQRRRGGGPISRTLGGGGPPARRRTPRRRRTLARRRRRPAASSGRNSSARPRAGRDEVHRAIEPAAERPRRLRVVVDGDAPLGLAHRVAEDRLDLVARDVRVADDAHRRLLVELRAPGRVALVEERRAELPARAVGQHHAVRHLGRERRARGAATRAGRHRGAAREETAAGETEAERAERTERAPAVRIAAVTRRVERATAHHHQFTSA